MPWFFFQILVLSGYMPKSGIVGSHCSVVSDSLGPHGLQHSRLPCPSPSGACSNSCPLSRWCHPIISSSVISFSCLQCFPASGSFTVSWLFASGGQSTGVSASASVPPMNIQDWFPLELTGVISLQSKELSKVSSITVQKQHSLTLNLLYGPTLTSVHDYRKNHSFNYTSRCQQSDVSAF